MSTVFHVGRTKGQPVLGPTPTHSTPLTPPHPTSPHPPVMFSSVFVRYCYPMRLAQFHLEQDKRAPEYTLGTLEAAASGGLFPTSAVAVDATLGPPARKPRYFFWRGCNSPKLWLSHPVCLFSSLGTRAIYFCDTPRGGCAKQAELV